MNLKGPELKVSEMKVPPFLSDLYYDLRDRRLLPLLALVVVAIVAVPFLLGDSPEEAPPPVAQSGGASPAGSAANTSKLTVVEATPGLRDYHKRLKGRTATDPFMQRFQTATGGGGGGGAEGGGAGASDAAGGPSVAVETESGETESGETVEVVPVPAPDSGEPPSPDDPNSRYFAFRPDVRFGLAGSEKLKNYEALKVGTRLPQKKPAVVFLGVSDDGRRATFAVSSEVAVVRGKGQCIGGAQSCLFLTLKAGDAVDLLTGVPDRSYRLSLMKIEWVEVDPPKPAKSSSASRQPHLDFSQSFSK